MVVTIFRSRLRTEYLDEYRPLAHEMLALARSMPGFRSFKSFAANDGERVSIIEFETMAHLEAFRDHPEHKKAMKLGIERYYSHYHLQVCTPDRDYEFKDGKRTDHTGAAG